MAVLSGGDWRRAVPDPAWRAYILKARERFLKGEAATVAEVRRLYRGVARQVRRDLEAVASGTLRQHHLRALERLLDRRARELNDELLKAIRAGIELSVREATRGAEQLALDVLAPVFEPPAIRRLFAAINERAVLALLSRTRGDGLRLSDRVWRVAERSRNAVRRVVEDGVTQGQDARTLARQVERYLQPGVRTALKPETRRRLRVPKDLSMEALRLAVTEVNTAFHEGTILAQRAIPSYLGVYWRLSTSHPVPDVCDRYATNNGNGFWPKGEEPERPHPWCRCVLVPAHEDPDAFVQRLRAWVRDPQSQPDLEAWYIGVREFLPRPQLPLFRVVQGAPSTGRPMPPGLRVPERVWQQYPVMVEALGSVLRVDHDDHPGVQQNLADLARVPPQLLRRLREAGLQEIHVANATVPGLDDLGDLAGKQPRGWPPGFTWDTVPGAYSPVKRVVVAGVGNHGSVSLVLHELGHAVGHLLGLDDAQGLVDAHREAYANLNPYLRQGGPGGLAGRQEMLAEGFATYYVRGREEVARRFGNRFLRFLEEEFGAHPGERSGGD